MATELRSGKVDRKICRLVAGQEECWVVRITPAGVQTKLAKRGERFADPVTPAAIYSVAMKQAATRREEEKLGDRKLRKSVRRGVLNP